MGDRDANETEILSQGSASIGALPPGLFLQAQHLCEQRGSETRSNKVRDLWRSIQGGVHKQETNMIRTTTPGIPTLRPIRLNILGAK